MGDQNTRDGYSLCCFIRCVYTGIRHDTQTSVLYHSVSNIASVNDVASRLVYCISSYAGGP